MKLSVKVSSDLLAMMKAEIAAGEKAVTVGVGRAAEGLKGGMRAAVVQAGLGRRLGNTIRHRVYPQTGYSMEAAGFVFTNADAIIDAHERGALIRPRSGFWLAIPTEAAGRGAGRRRLTPGEWERRNGMTLRLVRRRGNTALLVADNARLTKAGVARQKRGRRRRDGMLTGAQTVPIFVLVRQVRLPRRLDFDGEIARWSGRIPRMIVDAWGDRKTGGGR
jgi:hypothetical protein